MIVYVSIGNSDDKLSQVEWSSYVTEMDVTLADRSEIPDSPVLRRHGAWLSRSDAPWQNACWCVELEDADDAVKELQGRLRELLSSYRQDSIAWAPVLDWQGKREGVNRYTHLHRDSRP